MPSKLPKSDPIKVHQRKSVAARHIGLGAKCACGESRPEALIKRDELVICAECDRKEKGHSTTDAHHPSGLANSPITIRIPVKDHRAELSVAQYDWPRKTLENPDASPVLAGAAQVRGFIDTALYLVEKMLLWLAEMLESLDMYLVDKLGPKWWVKTPLEQFAPKR